MQPGKWNNKANKVYNMINKVIVSIILLSAMACTGVNSSVKDNGEDRKKEKKQVQVPSFSADSAYTYTGEQVAFGPRVPNSEAHQKCAQYLENQLKQFGADVIVQNAELRAFDNTLLHAKNIIGQYKPELNNRVLLFAHWDSRPFADQCEDKSKIKEPILGANDGASGVGVLLEIARHLQTADLAIGVDIIFFDAEDYGMPEFYEGDYVADSWCLGSQYWGKNPHKPNYYAKYGILLDMVGGTNAMFYRERYSMQFAPRVVKKIWQTAGDLGYSNNFVYQDGGMITDDHVYVNKYRNIPCVDIIQHDPSTDSNFASYWHTHHDNMDAVDKNTLKAVGQTLLQVLYSEE